MSDTSSKPQPRLKDRLETICVEMIDKGILFSEAVGQFEKCFIGEVVRRNEGNLMRAAADLGIHRNTLAKRMNHYRSKRRTK
jgi:transcriptional regulator with PAS, ATPase and Fis domain